MYKMIHGGMIGPILKVIHSMFESVMSVVWCGFDVSDVIHQFVGVRQGCVLSPCLFTLFIADLNSPIFTGQGLQGHNDQR